MAENKTTLVQVLHSTVKAARTGDYGNTAVLLNSALQLIQEEIVNGLAGKNGIKKLTYSLETLFMMQKSENWVAFADILEFELIPLWLQLHG